MFVEDHLDAFDIGQWDERGLTRRLNVPKIAGIHPVINGHDAYAEDVGGHRLRGYAVVRDIPCIPDPVVQLALNGYTLARAWWVPYHDGGRRLGVHL